MNSVKRLFVFWLSLLVLVSLLLTGCRSDQGDSSGTSESTTITRTGTIPNMNDPQQTDPASETTGDPTVDQSPSSSDNTTTGPQGGNGGGGGATSPTQTGAPTGSQPTGTTGGNTGVTKPPVNENPPVYTGISPTSPEAGTPFASMSSAPADKPVTVGPSTKQFGRFLLTTTDNRQLPFNVACYITNTTISAVLPAGVDLTAIKPNFTYYGNKVMMGNTEVKSQVTAINVTKPVTLTLVANDGSTKNMTLKIETLNTGLPSVAFNTANFAEITSTVNFMPASFYVGGGDKSVCPYAQSTPLRAAGQVRGRGTVTWAFDKKGYTIRFDQKQSIFGLASSKDWSLLAVYQDKSLLRNYTAAYISKQLGMPYTMGMYPVDLWMNGKYWGTYILAEKIEVEPARIDIPQYGVETAPDKVGYLVQFENYIASLPQSQKSQWQTRGKGIYDPVANEIYLKFDVFGEQYVLIERPSPQYMSNAHISYIHSALDGALKALKSGDYNEISKYIDVQSFVRWYLIEEFMNDPEASFGTNVYLYLPPGGKLTMGPVWSFDGSAGNSNSNVDPTGTPLYNHPIFNNLFKTAQAKNMLKTEWARLKPIANNLGSYIDKGAAMLKVSQDLNFKRWNILSKPIGTNPAVVVQANTYSKQVAYLKEYLNKRIPALDGFYSKL